MNDYKIATFTGVSGTGKTTIVKKLLEGDFRLIPSTTTRNPRESDLPSEYRYLSFEEFDRLGEEGEFLWTTEYAGQFYGTPYRVVQEAFKHDETSAMILVPEVVPLLRGYTDRVLSIYVRSPPEEVLRERLGARGDTVENIERRLADVRVWETQAEESDIPYQFITNDGTIDETVEQVRRILGS